MCTRGEMHGPGSGFEERSAARIRRELERRRTLMINLISSPGSGKTALLEAAISRLKRRVRLAALEGDVASDLDAARLCRQGVPARQILTGGACHLGADQIEREIGHLGHEPIDIILVENVGNLICPAAHDLGEDMRLVLLSVTEGDDTPFKYPAAFSGAAFVVVTKADLLPYVDFDIERARRGLHAVRPGVGVAITSARSGEGIDAWCGWLCERLEDKRTTAAQLAPTA